MSLGILCTAGEQARRTYESPKRFGDSGNTGHNASSSSRVGNALKRSSRSGNEFRATPTSPSDSATRKTLEISLTHLNGSNTQPANAYQSLSTQVEEPRRSTKRDDDDDDDEDGPKGPPKRSGGSGNTGHDVSSSSGVDNASKRSS
jgi:hypothetical protein